MSRRFSRRTASRHGPLSRWRRCALLGAGAAAVLVNGLVLPTIAAGAQDTSSDPSVHTEVPAAQAVVVADLADPQASRVVLEDGTEKGLDEVVLTSDTTELRLQMKASADGAEAPGSSEDSALVPLVGTVEDLAGDRGEDGLPTVSTAAGEDVEPGLDEAGGRATWSVPGGDPPEVSVWTFAEAGTYVLEVAAAGDADGPGNVAESGGGAANDLTLRVGEAENTEDTGQPGEPTGAGAAEDPASETASGPAGQESRGTTSALSALGAVTPFATSERRVLSKVHTDAISAYVDDGALVAATKADVDGAEGKRLDPDQIVFNIEPASLTTLPAGTPSWLGAPGQQVYWAPQTWDDKEIIWPGFSTQDPALIQALGDGGQVRYTLAGVKGPGSVEVFLNGNFGGAPTRWFSSTDEDYSYHDIPANTHAHANWVFSEAGRYELTFQMTASINGKAQTTQSTYVFYAGDAKGLRQATQTYLAATPDADGGHVTLQALVTSEVPNSNGLSYTTTGTVTVYRGSRDTADPATLEGMTAVASLPLKNGGATSDPLEDPDGDSVFVAVYRPTYSNEFASSTSDPADRTMPDLSRDGMTVAAATAGTDITAGSSVIGTLDADVDAPDGSGYVAWLRDTTGITRQLGSVEVADRVFSVALPDGLASSKWHKLALTDAEGTLLGWSEFTVVGDSGTVPDVPPDAPGGGADNPGGGGGNGGGGSGNQNGGGSGGQGGGGTGGGGSAGRVCQPGVTLDHGHMDIWNVTYSDGGIVMQIKEDATGSHVLRDPKTVLLQVKESALQSVPSGYPGGGGQAYVLPLTQDSTLIWPGWDTNGVKAGPFTDVSIHITSVSGPGSVFLYSEDSMGHLKSLFTDGGYQFPNTIREETPAHTHAQWTFTQKGVYVLKAYAEARNPQTGVTIKTATVPYVFQVGDVSIGDVFCDVGDDTSTAATASADDVAKAEAAEKAEEEAAAKAAAQAKAKAKAKGAQSGDGQSGAQSGAGAFGSLGGGAGSPWAYAGIGAGSVALAGGIALGTTVLIRRRNMQLAALANA
ncbi:MAG: choice-of-anchor M domain-containing protein [Actinomyces sp.]|jgi:surface-anchored protein|nr:choice-of-anchor M domain-containing protein [Actinomyces sp.]MCI1642881.1 choice-of-anchor M domain-containing protein [Actinomyces sp.]